MTTTLIKKIRNLVKGRKLVVANSVTIADENIPELIQICPFGVYEKDGIPQQCDTEAFNNIIANTPMPCLIDANHDSLDGQSDAYGWIRELAIHDTLGLVGKVEWTVLGSDAISNHIMRSLSPAWFLDADNRPCKLHSVSLVNTPNIEDIQPLWNSKTEVTNMNENEDNIEQEKKADDVVVETNDNNQEPVDENVVEDNEAPIDDPVDKPVIDNEDGQVEGDDEGKVDEVEALKARIAELEAVVADYKAKEEQAAMEAEADEFVDENKELVENAATLKQQYIDNPTATKQILANIRKIATHEPICKAKERLQMNTHEELDRLLRNAKTPEEKVAILLSRNWMA